MNDSKIKNEFFNFQQGLQQLLEDFKNGIPLLRPDDIVKMAEKVVKQIRIKPEPVISREDGV